MAILRLAVHNSIIGLTIGLLVGISRANEPLIVHKAVGEKIDRSERNVYALFPGVENFHSASFFTTDSNSIILKLEVTIKDRVSSETYPVSIFLINQINQQIENRLKGKTGLEAEPITLAVIDKERKHGREVFPGYAGSLFGGLITLLFVYELDLIDEPTKMETYVVWGTGSALVSALGVQKSGEFDDGVNTFGAAFGGALLGSALGILAFEGSLQTENAGLVALSVLFAKPLLTSYGAINGYYAAAKARYKSAIQMEKTGMHFEVPELRVEKKESIGNPYSVYKFSLLSVEF